MQSFCFVILYIRKRNNFATKKEGYEKTKYSMGADADLVRSCNFGRMLIK